MLAALLLLPLAQGPAAEPLVNANASALADFDGQGCFTPATACVGAPQETVDGYFSQRFINQCEGRIFIRACHQTGGGLWTCEEHGINQRQSVVVETAMPVTAKRLAYTGSLYETRDQVCAAKVDDWARPDEALRVPGEAN